MKSMKEIKNIIKKYDCTQEEELFLSKILTLEKDTIITIGNEIYRLEEIPNDHLIKVRGTDTIIHNVHFTMLLKCMNNIRTANKNTHIAHNGVIINRENQSVKLSQNSRELIAHEYFEDTEIYKLMKESNDVNPSCTSLDELKVIFEKLSTRFDRLYVDDILRTINEDILYRSEGCETTLVGLSSLMAIKNKLYNIRKSIVEKANAKIIENKKLYVQNKLSEPESIINRYSRNENDKKYLTNILKIEDNSPVIIDNEAYFLRSKEKYGLELYSLDNKIMSFRLYNDILDEGTSIYTFGKDSFICIKGHIYYKNRNYNTYDKLDISENTKDVLIADDFEETKINKIVKGLDELATHCKNNDKDIEYIKTKFKELSDEFYYKIYTDEIKSILKEKVIYLDKNLGFYSIGDGVLEYIKNHLRGLSIDIEKLKNKKDDTNYIIADPLDNTNTIDFKSFILNRPDFLDNGNFMITKENGTLIIKNNSESNIIKIHSNGTVEMNCVCSWENTLLIFKYIIEEIKRQIPELSFDVKYNFSISEGL